MNRDTGKGLGITALLFAVVAIAVYFVYSMTVAMLATPEGKTEGIRNSVVERIKPIGEVTLANAPSTAKKTVVKKARSGEAIFNSTCTACHTTGAAGAPIVGHQDLWAPRIAKGKAALFNSAKNGFNAMPAKGTCMDCTDDELTATIAYMVSKSGGFSQAPKAQPKMTQTTPAVEKKSTSPASVVQGKNVYSKVCMACHASGAAGAPIVGNKEQWTPRIAKGADTLIHSALNGFNAMPPKGGCMDCSDADIQTTVHYMIEKSQ